MSIVPLPSPSVEPLDPNGNIRRADIDAQLAKMIVPPNPHILNGDQITFDMRRPGGGGYVVTRTVFDQTVPQVVTLSQLVSGPKVEIFYWVDRSALRVGESDVVAYDIV